MRTPGAALEAHLREHPHDWTAWLVYADWLTDQGDVRGELVRLERALETQALSPAERVAIQQRIAAIEAEHVGRWRDEIPYVGELHWRFGFVVCVELEHASREGVAALAAHPLGRLLTELQYEHPYSDLDSLSEDLDAWTSSMPLRTLTIANSPGVTSVLAHHPGLNTLRSLTLAGIPYERSDDRAFARATSLARLESLDLAFGFLGTEALLEMLRSDALPALTRLTLGGTSGAQLRDAGACALAQSGRPLQHLGLAYNGLGPDSVSALLQAPWSRSLVSLDLSYNPLGPQGVSTLLRARELVALQSLKLAACRASGGLDDLGLAGLQELDLGLNELEVADVRALARSPLRLSSLALSNNPLALEGVAALLSNDRLESLRRLVLRSALLDDSAARVIAASPHLGALRVLDVSENPIGPEGAQALAASTTLRSLCELCLP